jgi:ABC-type polysaccharide/polyol phosphate transport system ATPase subunit
VVEGKEELRSVSVKGDLFFLPFAVKSVRRTDEKPSTQFDILIVSHQIAMFLAVCEKIIFLK